MNRNAFWVVGILLGLPTFLVPPPYNLLVCTLAFSLMLIGRPRKIYLWMILFGAFLNGTAIFANGGKMPVLEPHIPIPIKNKTHITLTDNTRFIALTDIMGSKNIRFSLGDLFVFFAFPMAGVDIFNEVRRKREA